MLTTERCGEGNDGRLELDVKLSGVRPKDDDEGSEFASAGATVGGRVCKGIVGYRIWGGGWWMKVG